MTQPAKLGLTSSLQNIFVKSLDMDGCYHSSVKIDRPFPNTYWVIPHRLLAGEYPGDADKARAQTRLASLAAAGINLFIDLTEEGELPPYHPLLPTSARHLRSAVVDCSVPYNITQTVGLLSSIREGLSSGRNLYIHCRAGIGRTGLIVGCYLAEELSSGRGALKQLNLLWRESERSRDWPKVPQTAEQADYVRHWLKFSKRAAQRMHARIGDSRV
jgi:hypothetical protein